MVNSKFAMRRNIGYVFKLHRGEKMTKIACAVMMAWLVLGCASGSSGRGDGYLVKYARIKPEFSGGWAAYWNSPAWRQANTVSIDEWSTLSTATRPRTDAKVLYDESGIRLLWRVEHDNYIIAKATQLNGAVSRDSCVEFFVEPDKALGYTSFEVNAGGTFLWNVHRPAGDVRKKYPPAYRDPEAPTTDTARLIRIRHSLPTAPIYPAIELPTTWYIELFIPIEALQAIFPIAPEDLPGARWRCNFFKILGSRDPVIGRHKHYAYWKHTGPIHLFHQPAFFGDLYFQKP